MADSTHLKVSVIIPAFNAAHWIEKTIQSVVDQSITSWELIIVNDGSTDNTQKIIEQCSKADSRIRAINQSNRGVSSARNSGYELSNGEYLAFLDADDLWLPDNLALKLEKFGTAPYGLVHSDAEVMDERGVRNGQILSGQEGHLLEAMLAWQATQVPGPSSILVRRSVMETIGLFDEKLSTSADQDFFIRVAARFLIGRVPQVTWHYRVHRNNMHKNVHRMEVDVLAVYSKAEKENRFKNQAFKRQCFANMYLILAASWAGDGKNWLRAIRFGGLAVGTNPLIIFKLPGRILKWLIG